MIAKTDPKIHNHDSFYWWIANKFLMFCVVNGVTGFFISVFLDKRDGLSTYAAVAVNANYLSVAAICLTLWFVVPIIIKVANEREVYP